MKIDSKILFCNCLGIFQGGGVKAIAYAGAYDEAKKSGINFSDVAGTSAGAIFAALIAAGATPEKILEIARSNEIKKIPNPHIPEKCQQYVIFILGIISLLGLLWIISGGHSWFWPIFIIGFILIVSTEFIITVRNNRLSLKRYFGLHDSAQISKIVDNWLHEIISTEEDITFNKLQFKLTVYSCDVNRKEVKRWSRDNAGEVKVADAVAASCSIPIYFSPFKLKDGYQVDGGLLINRPNRIYNTMPNYFQALSFKLKSNDNSIKSLTNYILALINTIVDGPETLDNQDKKTETTIYGHNGVNDVVIGIDNVSSTSFDKLTEEMVENLIQSGREAMRVFIEETNDRLRMKGSESFSVSSNRTLDDIDYMHNQVAFWSYERCEQILIADKDLGWVWPLFPTLISWINNNIKIIVKYSRSTVPKNEIPKLDAQLRMLKFLGIQPADIQPTELIKGFFFRKDNDCKCILFEEEEKSEEANTKDVGDSNVFPPKNTTIYTGKVYNSGLDSIFVTRIMDTLVQSSPNNMKCNVILKSEDKKTYMEILKSMEVYKNVDNVEYHNIDIKNLRFVKKEIRSLKVKELRIIDDLYDKARIPRYTPASLTFLDDKTSYMTPIVVENHNGKYVVIKGNSRCYKIFSDKGIDATVPAFIIENPPSLNGKETYEITKLFLSEKKNRGAGSLNPNRAVDQAFRPNDTYLK